MNKNPSMPKVNPNTLIELKNKRFCMFRMTNFNSIMTSPNPQCGFFCVGMFDFKICKKS